LALDFFEGFSSLRTYAHPRLKVPSGGLEIGLETAMTLTGDHPRCETHNPPGQLAFHDHMQLGLTMRHVNRRVWENHNAEYRAARC